MPEERWAMPEERWAMKDLLVTAGLLLLFCVFLASPVTLPGRRLVEQSSLKGRAPAPKTASKTDVPRKRFRKLVEDLEQEEDMRRFLRKRRIAVPSACGGKTSITILDPEKKAMDALKIQYIRKHTQLGLSIPADVDPEEVLPHIDALSAKEKSALSAIERKHGAADPQILVFRNVPLGVDGCSHRNLLSLCSLHLVSSGRSRKKGAKKTVARSLPVFVRMDQSGTAEIEAVSFLGRGSIIFTVGFQRLTCVPKPKRLPDHVNPCPATYMIAKSSKASTVLVFLQSKGGFKLLKRVDAVPASINPYWSNTFHVRSAIHQVNGRVILVLVEESRHEHKVKDKESWSFDVQLYSVSSDGKKLLLLKGLARRRLLNRPELKEYKNKARLIRLAKGRGNHKLSWDDVINGSE